MDNISFIIPCGRIPFEKSGKLTVDSILAYHPNAEILVSSKEKIKYRNIIYIKEDENNYGAVRPTNTMVRLTSNNFICLLNDDFFIKNNLNPIINYIKSNNLIGLTLMPIDWKRTGYGNIPSYIFHVPLNIPNMPFPIIKKEFIIKNKGLFDDRFAHHYADCALAFILKCMYNQKDIVYDDGIIYI